MTSQPLTTREAFHRAVAAAPRIKEGLWRIFLFNAAGTGVQVLVPVVIQQTVDRFLAGDEVDVAGVVFAAVVGLVLIAVGASLARAGLVRLVVNAAGALSTLRVAAFGRLMQRSVLHVESDRRGALVSRVTSDITTIQEFMNWGGVMMLVNTTQAAVAIAAMLIYEWRLGLLIVAGVFLYVASLLGFQRVLRRRYDVLREEVADNLAVLGEAVTALPEVRAYGAEASMMRRVRSSLDRRFGIEFRTFRFGNVLFATSELFAASLTAVALAAGLWIGPEGGITAGVLLAFLFLVNLLVEPVQNLVEVLEFAQSAGAGLRRVAGTLDDRDDLPEPTEPCAIPYGPLDVRFDRVGFRYPGGTQALIDVSAVIEPGSRVAVVGETGSGKTTFGKLLVRLLDPHHGSVRIGGCDLRDVATKDLRIRVAFVPQEGFLFSGTVADNVRYGKPGATDREIRAAFLELDLDGWLDGLAARLDTAVGPRGTNLSAGERQLVALVRAWISTPDLLVLDEATSAVDPALDVQIRRAIDRLTAGRTSVTIAHRLATAEAADTILVFDSGRLSERGSHEELLAQNGTYAMLYHDWIAGTATF